MFQRTMIGAAVAGLLFAVAPPANAAEMASPNDTARFLAGMPPAADSPLMPLTDNGTWKAHARSFDAAFGRLEQRQLTKIRAWSGRTLANSRPTVFYMFSGPDFLYANAVFPNAKTYVLGALEPVGSVPDLTRLRGSIGPNLRNIESSLNSILSFSFFITKKMKTDLQAGQVTGALPLLYVFLARSGKTILEAAPVWIDDRGALHPETEPAQKGATHGVRIAFSGADGEARTLYYFSTNLDDGGVRSSGFLKFLATLAPADSLVKSASYLLHSGSFSRIREFLLANSAVMVQDDSGIPLAYYNAKAWEMHPFGRYLGPISLFPGRYQAQYAAVFRNSRPIDFGIGYRWRSNESNLLVAVKTASAVPAEPAQTPVAAAPAAGSGAAPVAAAASANVTGGAAPTVQNGEPQATPPATPKRRTASRARRESAYLPPPYRPRSPFEAWFQTFPPFRSFR